MILIGTSEAGSAKYISCIVKNIPLDFICVSSKISASVFEEEGVSHTQDLNEIDFKSLNLIITGTCLGEGIDKELIKLGSTNDIPTASIIDHWTWYYKRFLLDHNLVYPDCIFVNDEFARKAAISEGIKESLLTIVGNPVLEIKSRRILIPLPKNEWLKSLNLNNKKTITFISETLREDFPPGSDSFLGFEEFVVINDLKQIAKEFEYNLLLKLHPSETLDKYVAYLDNSVVIIDTINHFDSIVANSDYIIGMGSMFLIEASLFREDILSYRPNQQKDFIGNQMGLTCLIQDKNELRKVFSGERRIKNQTAVKKFDGSLQRIQNIILDIQK